MAIYTRAGDKGKTFLAEDRRVGKDNQCIWFVGEIDELNSVLGLTAILLKERKEKEFIEKIQADLFLIGASLAGEKQENFVGYLAKRIKDLEKEIDKLEGELPPLGNFILPGGSQTASLFHFSRSVCRRAERRMVELTKKQDLEEQIMVFLNRLSDLLFVLARTENKKAGIKEKIWQKGS